MLKIIEQYFKKRMWEYSKQTYRVTMSMRNSIDMLCVTLGMDEEGAIKHIPDDFCALCIRQFNYVLESTVDEEIVERMRLTTMWREYYVQDQKGHIIPRCVDELEPSLITTHEDVDGIVKNFCSLVKTAFHRIKYYYTSNSLIKGFLAYLENSDEGWVDESVEQLCTQIEFIGKAIKDYKASLVLQCDKECKKRDRKVTPRYYYDQKISASSWDEHQHIHFRDLLLEIRDELSKYEAISVLEVTNILTAIADKVAGLVN